MSGFFKRLAPGLLLVASLTLVAGVAEVVLRVRHGWKTQEILAKSPDRDLCTEADPELIYRYRAGHCGFNRRGFRDDDHSATPPPGTLRFVVIGDSVAAGDGVEIEERFDRVLERRLAASGVRAEAINLARTGYSTSQELLLLERDAYAYRPDVVVWSYVLNDPADPVFHDANGKLGRYFFQPDIQLVHRLRRLVFDTREKLAEQRCGREFHALLHCAYAEQVSASIARIGALARAHATPTVFVIHPVFEPERGFGDSSFAPLHAQLSREARDADLVVVDLLDAYRGVDPASLQQDDPDWFDPWHPNARGHALAAEAIEPALLRVASGKEDEAGDGGGEAEEEGGGA
jgi:lysophospholipase L1-like esterase